MSLLLIRPFHIVHQWSLILMVIFTKSIYSVVSALDLFVVWLLVFLVMPLLFAINDLMHLEEDRKMGRDRLFTAVSVPPQFLKTVLGSILALLLLISVLRSVTTFIALILLIIFASAYGYYKHKRRTLLTYLFRSLSGFALYLVISSYFALTSTDILLAVFVAMTDLQVHIIGDVRDIKKDKVAELKTLPALYGIPTTNIIVLLLQLFSTSYLMIISNIKDVIVFDNGHLLNTDLGQIPISSILFIVIFYAVAWVIYLRFLHRGEIPYQWLHACFHGAKVLTFLAIALSTDAFQLTDLLWLLVFLVIWFISYLTYLWADDRL